MADISKAEKRAEQMKAQMHRHNLTYTAFVSNVLDGLISGAKKAGVDPYDSARGNKTYDYLRNALPGAIEKANLGKRYILPKGSDADFASRTYGIELVDPLQWTECLNSGNFVDAVRLKLEHETMEHPNNVRWRQTCRVAAGAFIQEQTPKVALESILSKLAAEPGIGDAMKKAIASADKDAMLHNRLKIATDYFEGAIRSPDYFKTYTFKG